MKHGLVAICLIVFSSAGLAQIRKKVVVDDQQAEREEWFYSQRAYPLGRIPTGARLKAIAEIDRMDGELRARQPQFVAEESESTTAAALAVGKWKSIGPRP